MVKLPEDKLCEFEVGLIVDVVLVIKVDAIVGDVGMVELCTVVDVVVLRM